MHSERYLFFFSSAIVLSFFFFGVATRYACDVLSDCFLRVFLVFFFFAIIIITVITSRFFFLLYSPFGGFHRALCVCVCAWVCVACRRIFILLIFSTMMVACHNLKIKSQMHLVDETKRTKKYFAQVLANDLSFPLKRQHSSALLFQVFVFSMHEIWFRRAKQMLFVC